MKRILISIFSLVLILSTFSFGNSAFATGTETPNNLIEPFAVDPGDSIPYCAKTFNSTDGASYVVIQTYANGKERSIQWSFRIKPAYYSKYGSETKTWISTARVNDRDINSPYSYHIESPDYNFHGSLKNYQLHGTNVAFKANDIVYFKFNSVSRSKVDAATSVKVKCRIK